MAYTICIVYIYGHSYNNSNKRAEKGSPCYQEQFTFKKKSDVTDVLKSITFNSTVYLKHSIKLFLSE